MALERECVGDGILMGNLKVAPRHTHGHDLDPGTYSWGSIFN